MTIPYRQKTIVNYSLAVGDFECLRVAVHELVRLRGSCPQLGQSLRNLHDCCLAVFLVPFDFDEHTWLSICSEAQPVFLSKLRTLTSVLMQAEQLLASTIFSISLISPPATETKSVFLSIMSTRLGFVGVAGGAA